MFTELNASLIGILIISGLLVGFINTLAGGGTIISLSLFMLMGMPPTLANGTNRVAVVMQTMTSSLGFRRRHALDLTVATRLAIPVVLGSLLGTWLAVDLPARVFEWILAIAMVVMLFFLLFKPDRWLGDPNTPTKPKSTPALMLVLFLIGIYGGLIYVGVGYYLLAAAVIGAGYDLLRANAAKVWIVLLYVPFTLIIFMWHDQVNYRVGLIHGIGNVVGAWMATRFAVQWGVRFVRWVLVVVVILMLLQTFGILHIQHIIHNLL